MSASDSPREEAEAQEAANLPIVATSPAVGVFQRRKDLAPGCESVAGDRLARWTCSASGGT